MKNLFSDLSKNYLMYCNGFSCGLNTPNALHGEETFSLPPYAQRTPYLVDEYPACPTNWVRSEGRTKSYFVAVNEGKGMWLDFNENAIDKTHHVAIVISIQGVNPITGLPCKDASLEQYIDECPKHKIKFGPDRYCEKCGFKWPKQNYICTTGTPNGLLWLDGFKTAEGVVRQYILTAEKIKGVASNIIGKDRVFAIGVSFFLSKDKKPDNASKIYRDNSIQHFMTFDYHSIPNSWDTGSIPNSWDTHIISTSACASASAYSQSVEVKSLSSQGNTNCRYISNSETKPTKGILRSGHVSTKKLEVAAGAKIEQLVYSDPEKLDYWQNEPEAIICVNYCTEEDATKIIEAGHSPINSHPEGFLKDIPVGN